VGIPSTDTVWEVRQDFDRDLSKFIARIPERHTMWRAQTPQAFHLLLIRDAYQCALQDPQFHATDDCGVVRRYLPGTKIIVVPGEEQNRKITFADDLR
jgi:2-C-methyl-D-erythritol 4-phosphate cytidylyltransferase